MNWDVADFVVFFAMLAGAGGAYRVASRRSSGATYRVATGLALATAFLLLWVNGAVGIIGDENNDANLMYFGVLAVALAGALLVRLQPAGMAWTMFATAVAQGLVAGIALLAAPEPAGPAWPADVLVLTAFFAALWLLSARLFQVAARRAA